MPNTTRKGFSVYKITCLVSGRAYIGVTQLGIRARWLRHLSSAYNPKRHEQIKFLYRAIRKHGEDSFKIELLYEAASAEEMYTVERALIANHNTFRPNGYNMAIGGQGPRGFVVTDDFRRRVSAASKGRMLGVKLTEKRKQHLREFYSTPEGRVIQAEKGKFTRTAEYRAKQAEASKISWIKRKDRYGRTGGNLSGERMTCAQKNRIRDPITGRWN